VASDPEQQIIVDLKQQTISCAEVSVTFTIDPVSRNQLLNGWDDVDLTESYRARIASFKVLDRQRRRWAVPAR